MTMCIIWKSIEWRVKGLLLISFFMSLGFYSFIPYLTLYMTQTYKWSMALTGALLGTRQICQQGCMFLGGAISDKIGWKRALMLGCFFRGVGFLSFGWCSETFSFFLSATISGFAGALFDPSEKAIFEFLLPEEGRNKVIALRTVMANLAFACSAIFGSLLYTVNFFTLSFLSGMIFIIISILVFFLFPNYLNQVFTTKKWWYGIYHVIQDRDFVLYTAILIGYYYLYCQLYLLIPKAVMDNTQSQSHVTLVYFVISLTVVLLQIYILQLFPSTKDPFFILGIGAALLGGGIFSLGQAQGFISCVLAGGIFALGIIFSSPMVFEIVSLFSSKKWPASYFGFNALAQGVGGLFSSILGGWTYDIGKTQIHPQLPWITCLILSWIVFLCLFFFSLKRKSI